MDSLKNLEPEYKTMGQIQLISADESDNNFYALSENLKEFTVDKPEEGSEKGSTNSNEKNKGLR